MLALMMSNDAAARNGTEVRIGALAHRADSVAMWAPTAEYLTDAIPGYRFVIVPLDNQSIDPAVERGKVDFVLTNPGSYVTLEARYGASRIATLRNLRQERSYTEFGSVIFTRAARQDIRTLNDLKGKSFTAVSKDAFGGFLVGWRELKDHDVDPFSDLAALMFAGLPQDKVVHAVREGKVDAGIVRTDTLERMAAEGKIELGEFYVLNQQHVPGFPFLLSTRLYPEWPFAKVKHTPDRLAQKVAIALLSVPDNSATAAVPRSAGWTVPLDYNRVHELYRELRQGPYEDFGKVTLAEVVRAYWFWIVVVFGVVLLLSVNTAYILSLNRGLKRSQQQMLDITAQLELSNEQLEKLSIVDDLTGIANHRAFQEHLAREWRRTQRNQIPLSLFMIDIDFFKDLNDRYGHLAGDQCLRRVAQTLRRLARRPEDLVARYGGEEFAVVLPELAREGAAFLAEKMRATIEALQIPHATSQVGPCVTISIGAATVIPAREALPDEAVAAADAALYEAKKAGRNRIKIAEVK